MMTHRLRSYEIGIPGQYPYREEGPKPRTFAPVPIIEYQARTVLGYRKGNGLPRATYAEALMDVDRYQCWRLGNNPDFCIPLNEPQSTEIALASNAPGLVPCAGCGAVVS